MERNGQPGGPHAALWLGAAWTTFTVGFLALHPQIGDPVAVIFLLPVVVSAWLYGTRAGLLAATLSVAWLGLLFTLERSDLAPRDTFALFLERAPLSGLVGGLVGGAVGHLRDLRGELLRQRQQLLEQHEQLLEQQRRLAYQASHDALTGLPNRRAFDTDLDAACGGEAWARGRFAVLMLDLDGLKRVNDTRGHEGGDRLLREFAWALRRSLPPTDRVYRLGGDEYAILPGPGVTVPQETVGQVRAAILAVQAAGFPEVNVSVGLACSGEAASTGELVRLADERLYVHKRSRRPARPTR